MRAVAATVVGGVVGGTLDITYAVLAYGAKGVSAMVIFQSIAGGLMGRESYSGGVQSAVLGAALHFLIALLMAAGFVALARTVPSLLRAPFRSAAVYGLVLFALMNYVVVPLSAAYPGTPPRGWLLAGALFAHIVLVALPIVLSARHFLARP